MTSLDSKVAPSAAAAAADSKRVSFEVMEALPDTGASKPAAAAKPVAVETKTAASATSGQDADGAGEQEEKLPDFSDEEIEEMKRVFSLFDFQGTGHVATEDLGTIVRGLGFNITERALSDYINANDHDGSGKFDFEVFFSILNNNRPMRGPPTENEVVDFFKPFDIYKTGQISAEDMFNMLHKMGEPLPLEDINNLLTEISIDGDQMIDIRGFVQHMLDTSAPSAEAEVAAAEELAEEDEDGEEAEAAAAAAGS